MPRASINGADLYYEIEGDGDWVVFAHGGDGNHLCWWKQVAALKSRFRCLTYDAQGYGLSECKIRANGDPSAPTDDLSALMDHLGIAKAFLVGHSMGGMAVSGVAQRHPERLRGLVMSDTPFGFATPALSRWAEQMIEKISAGFNVMEHLFAPGFAAAEPELHHLYTAICRIKLPDAGSAPPAGDPCDPYRRMRDMPHGDYSGFPVPTLFVVGDQDELTLPWMIEGTADAVGGARLQVIPGAGHSPFVEQSLAYNSQLVDFFSGL